MRRSLCWACRWTRALVCSGLAFATLTAGAAAGPMDFLFSTGAVPASDVSRTNPRTWKVGEYSALRLVPREAGAAPNAQPLQVNGEALRSALATLQITLPDGRAQPLFAAGELVDLVPAVGAALAGAGPDDDIALLSTSRREDGVLATPMSITGRLFVRDGALQFIVQDTRADLYSPFRAARVVPALKFGSRTADSGAAVRGSAAASRRADWLAFDLRSAPGAAAATLAVPPPTSAPAPARPPTSGEPAAATAAAPAPAARPRDTPFFDEQEQRLRGLKRLRDQGLISEAEYEEKRREILKSL